MIVTVRPYLSTRARYKRSRSTLRDRFSMSSSIRQAEQAYVGAWRGRLKSKQYIHVACSKIIWLLKSLSLSLCVSLSLALCLCSSLLACVRKYGGASPDALSCFTFICTFICVCIFSTPMQGHGPHDYRLLQPQHIARAPFFSRPSGSASSSVFDISSLCRGVAFPLLSPSKLSLSDDIGF